MKQKTTKLLWTLSFHEVDLMTRFSHNGKSYLKTSKTEGTEQASQKSTTIPANTTVQIRVPWKEINLKNTTLTRLPIRTIKKPDELLEPT